MKIRRGESARQRRDLGVTQEGLGEGVLGHGQASPVALSNTSRL